MVLQPDLPEAQIRETIDRTRRLIEGMNGEVRQVQEWGMRELAYPIRRSSRGYYVLVEYLGKADVVAEIDRTFKIADEILRFITVAVGAAKERRKPSKRPRRRDRDEHGEGAQDASESEVSEGTT
jgi:small subunit ribosomal protein S6